MAKVKKTAVVTGVRNVKASKKPGRKPGSRAATSGSAAKQARRTPKAGDRKASAKATRITGKGRTSRSRTETRTMASVNSISKARVKARASAPAPVVRVAVKPLEPQAKCGAGTSVQYLFRVDESVDGRTTTHLVFFDRHGWYCEHGRNCPAVGHARKYQGRIARAS